MTTLAAVIVEGIYADIPAAGMAGRLYFATDTLKVWYDNGTTWDNVTPAGGVTSVAVTVPARQSVAGSPLTSAGTLAITDNTQATNAIFGGPASGAAAAPTFRSLVAADLPATAVTPGSYTSTNLTVGADGRITAASNGSGSGTLVENITLFIDGGGSPIATGQKAFTSIPFACTIQSITLLADVAGSVVVDIWKTTYASYDPGTHPAVGDSITASDLPTLSSAYKSTDSTLTGWTTAISAGDILQFVVNSASTVTRLMLVLTVER